MNDDRTDASDRASPRGTSALDKQIGARLRLARQFAGLSQTALGDAVGVTFQQIQKYERGTNRIAASRLHQFAVVLNQPLTFFYSGYEVDPAADADQPRFDLADCPNINARDAQRMLTALNKCPPDLRRKVIDMVSALATEASE